jgi:UDP-2,3-diacylglucosamine pyrophosphatase LpxH
MILVLSDLHLNDTPRDAYRIRFLEKLPKLASQHKAQTVYILGDLTQTKDKHSGRLVNTITDLMAELARDCQVYILRGNHDYTEIDHPFFRFLSHIQRISFLNKPTTIGTHLFLPHTRDYKHDWRGVSFKGVDMVLTHNTFQGARGENGQNLDGIPLNALPRLRIVSGDVHVPQILGTVTYVGAPYTINFGDTFAPRALLVNGLIKSILLDGPQKRLVHVRQDGAVDLNGAKRGDIVRIELEMLQEDYAEWTELRTRCEEFCTDEGFVLEKIIPILTDMQPYREERKAKFRNRSDEEIVRAYCRRHDVDEGTLKVGVESL